MERTTQWKTTAATARKTGYSPWNVEDSLDLYGVNAWGNGYFGINAAGHAVVRPDWRAEREIDLHEVITGLAARDLTTPVVVRFSDILRHRLTRIRDAFATAIAENEYRNRYCAVFPIKVNQQRLVVEEIYGYGREFGFGLEVGSKPELLAVMALTEGESERLIICNGFKDDSYIEAVILAAKLGRTIIPVVENFDELHLILKHAKKYERASAHRRARQARERRRRSLARVLGREEQVRPVRDRDPAARRACSGSTAWRTACSSCTATRAASCRTSAGSRTRSRSSRTSTPS